MGLAQISFGQGNGGGGIVDQIEMLKAGDLTFDIPFSAAGCQDDIGFSGIEQSDKVSLSPIFNKTDDGIGMKEEFVMELGKHGFVPFLEILILDSGIG